MRVTSDFFVSALIRRVSSAGGFAAVLRRGSAEAGAIHVVQLHADRTASHFGPASQSVFETGRPDERRFELAAQRLDEPGLAARIAREVRFDPDVWVVEIEGVDERIGDFLTVASTPQT